MGKHVELAVLLVAVDHVEPKASGGHGGDHNGAVACRRCNRDKSTKPLEDRDDELRGFLDD
ncbi:HNH endonuclease [Streptomyces sp. 184]|uniref:HNH endonuclease n=1 Tax=Streptomyces sp. 184 TaxID=1827526 RepID=UPI003891BBD0